MGTNGALVCGRREVKVTVEVVLTSEREKMWSGSVEYCEESGLGFCGCEERWKGRRWLVPVERCRQGVDV